MANYAPKIYKDNGGNRMTFGAGSSLVKGDSTSNKVKFSIASGSSNISNVTITVADLDDTAAAAVHHLDVWLSDAASGAGLTGTTASGTVTNKSASGVVLSTYTAKKALRVQTLATGVFTLEITDTAKSGFYVCAAGPDGRAFVSSQLVTGSYG
ncbi:hypothetical protein [Anatilimnocola floriformis]|uniref:hypothetical protein n=1 Tax=Anatilimnocola floriformis TaxID=2948575 RepID=UPI0020C51D4C|nr:hypothetical protein [Anatilimnocola floriformis]